MLKNKILHVRLSEEDANRWYKLAKAQGITSSVLSRRLIQTFLSDHAQAEDSRGLDPIEPTQSTSRKILKIRLTENEYFNFSKVSKQLCMSNQECLVRVVRAFLMNGYVVSENESEAVKLYVQEIRKIGVNLNQIAKRINEAAAVEVSSDLIRTALSEIEEVKGKIRTQENQIENFLKRTRGRSKIDLQI